MSEEDRQFFQRRALKALFEAMGETPYFVWPEVAEVRKWAATSSGPFGEAYEELLAHLRDIYPDDPAWEASDE